MLASVCRSHLPASNDCPEACKFEAESRAWPERGPRQLRKDVQGLRLNVLGLIATLHSDLFRLGVNFLISLMASFLSVQQIPSAIILLASKSKTNDYV